MVNKVDINTFFEYAKARVLEAGKIVMQGFKTNQEVEMKAVDWDFVTNCDREVEKFLIDSLSKKFTNHRFVAEESAYRKFTDFTDAPTWFIDPIDGTTNFIHGLPQCCISVALAIKKIIYLGIIYNPSNGELYTAKRGEGAFLNEERIQTSKVTELKKSLIVLEPLIMRKDIKDREIKVRRMETLINATQGCRSFGSAALSMAYIARGVIDCFHVESLQPWDIAAGMLIVREAGGFVIDSHGAELNIMKPSTIAVATDKLATEMSNLIILADAEIKNKCSE